MISRCTSEKLVLASAVCSESDAASWVVVNDLPSSCYSTDPTLRNNKAFHLLQSLLFQSVHNAAVFSARTAWTPAGWQARPWRARAHSPLLSAFPSALSSLQPSDYKIRFGPRWTCSQLLFTGVSLNFRGNMHFRSLLSLRSWVWILNEVKGMISC